MSSVPPPIVEFSKEIVEPSFEEAEAGKLNDTHGYMEVCVCICIDAMHSYVDGLHIVFTQTNTKFCCLNQLQFFFMHRK